MADERGREAGGRTGPHAGLCETCAHCRIVPSARSTFYLCERSFTDPEFVKYPPLPVRVCAGYETAAKPVCD